MEAVPAEHRPDYPPKTPPPPKRPVEPPRPNEPVAAPAVIRNRRGVNWPFEAADWTPAVASRRVRARLRAWGHSFDDDAVDTATRLLVRAALLDGGRRISVHLTPYGHMVGVLVISHHPPVEDRGAAALDNLARLPAVAGCGAESGPDGRRLWALMAPAGPAARTRRAAR